MKEQAVPAQVLEEMKDYYRVRATEYDEWFYRQGRYNRGAELNQRWFDEVALVETALTKLNLSGNILELAPGTGIWTQQLLKTADTITAVDASTEMIEINQVKLNYDPRVKYSQVDLFNWQPDQQYDGICFGFWLSHVPVGQLTDFAKLVSRALKPGGKVFFIDSRREPTSTAADHILPAEGDQIMTRQLNDGRQYQIVKNFFEPALLTAQFGEADLSVNVQQTPTYFIYGTGNKQA